MYPRHMIVRPSANLHVAHQQHFAGTGTGVGAHQRGPDPAPVIARPVHQIALQLHHLPDPQRCQLPRNQPVIGNDVRVGAVGGDDLWVQAGPGWSLPEIESAGL